MSGDEPIFFLTGAGEGKTLAEPRTCWQMKRMRDSVRDDYMLISVEPPFRQPHGIGTTDVYKLVVACRFQGQSLYPITSWPCHVFVYRSLHAILPEQTDFGQGDLQVIAWAMLFRTGEEADALYRKSLSVK
jgi:hypothetical protein